MGAGLYLWRHLAMRASSQQFYNLLYNKFTTNGQKFATSQHLDMSRCCALALRCGKFVVQQVVKLLRACPLVMVVYNMSVAGVRVVEFGTYAESLISFKRRIKTHLYHCACLS